MKSFIVLEAPNGPDRNHASTRFIADKFAIIAIFVPWLWLAFNRMWLEAIAVLCLQLLLAFIGDYYQLAALGIAGAYGVALIVAFEGRNYIIRALEAKGWNIKAIISADNTYTAELIYYSSPIQTHKNDHGVIGDVIWKTSENIAPTFSNEDPAGIFHFDLKGRR